jgi:hypothetical protein
MGVYAFLLSCVRILLGAVLLQFFLKENAFFFNIQPLPPHYKNAEEFLFVTNQFFYFI